MALSNSELIAHYRRTQPGTIASDDLILTQFSNRAIKAGTLDQFPELNEYVRQKERESRPSLLTEAGRGLASGTDTAQAKLFGTLEFAGETAGLDELARYGREGRQRNEQEATINAPSVARFEDVDNAEDLAYWLTGVASQSAPALAGTVAATPAATASAPVIGVGATTAGLVAGGIAGFTQMQNYGELRDQGVSQGNATVAATAAGTLGAALDVILPQMLATRLTKSVIGEATEAAAKASLADAAAFAPTEALKRYGKQFAEGTLTEGATEFGQELASIGSEIWANRDNPDFKIDADDIRSRLLNAAVGGGLVGGPADVAVGLFERNVAGVPRGVSIAEPVGEAPVVAPLGSPVEIARSRQEAVQSFRFSPGDVINVKGVGDTIAVPATEVLGASVDPATQQVVYTVAGPEGQPVTVPQNQVEVYDPNSPAAQERARQAAALRENQLKQELVTPQIQTALSEAGLSAEEIATWTPGELLARYAEVRSSRPAPTQISDDVVYRNQEGVVTRGPVPAEGIQGNLFGVGEINPPPSIQTVADYQNWREGQIKARANENLARMRDDRDALGNPDIGPMAPINPAAAGGMQFNADGRQSLLDFSEDPLVRQAESAIAREVRLENDELAAEISADEAVAMNRADLLADADELKGLLEARGASPDTAVQIIDALVNDAGGWNNPRSSLLGFVRSARRVAAETEREQARSSKAAEALRRREDRLRADLVARGATSEFADATLANMRGDAAKSEEIFSAAIIQLKQEAAVRLASANEAANQRALDIAEGRTPEAAESRINLARGWLAGAGPIAYAESFSPVTLTEDDPQLKRILRKAAGRKAIAFVEGDRVVLRQILRVRNRTLTVAKRQAGLSQADAISRIRANLEANGVTEKFSDVFIAKSLSENPAQYERLDPAKVQAVRTANADVGYTSADNVPLLGENGYLSSHRVAGFVTSAENRLGRSVTNFQSLRAFEAFVGDMRNPEVNSAYAGADPDVVAEVVTSLDKQTGEADSRTIGEGVADPLAADPGEMLDIKERVRDTIAAGGGVDTALVEDLARFVARFRDAQIQANPARSEADWNEMLRAGSNNREASQVFELLKSSGSVADERLLAAVQSIESPEVTLGTIHAAFKRAAEIPVKRRAQRLKVVKPQQEDPVPSTAPNPPSAAAFMSNVGISRDGLEKIIGDVARAGRSPSKQAVSARALIGAAEKYYKDLGVPFPEEVEDQIQTAVAFGLSALDGMRTIRPNPGSAFRPNDAYSRQRFSETIQSAAGLGIRISATQLRTDIADGFFNVVGGRYRPAEDAVQLVLADLASPSRADFVAAYHEVLHSITANAPDHVRTALHAAWNNLDLNRLAQKNNPEADVRLQSGRRPSEMSDQEWLEENFVEDRALRFVDKTYARNVFAYAWRALREFYYRGVAWLQKQTGIGVDPGVALGLIDARFDRFAAGDFLNRFGGEVGLFDRLNRAIRPQQTAINLIGTQGVRLDPATGNISYLESTGDTESQLRYNLNVPREEFIEWADRGGYSDLQATGLLTARGGFNFSPRNVGNSINDVNWESMPVMGVVPSALLARAGNMDRAVELFANRAALWPETVQTADNLTVRTFPTDTAQGGGKLGRARHFTYGMTGTPASTPTEALPQIIRLRLASKVLDTLTNPLIIADGEPNTRVYISRYELDGRGYVHAVIVGNVERGTSPFVVTQLALLRDSQEDRFNWKIRNIPAAVEPQVLEKNRTSIGTQDPSSSTPNLPGAERAQAEADFSETVKLTVRQAAAAAQSDYRSQAEIHRARTVAVARAHIAAYNTLHWRLAGAYNMARAEGKAGDLNFESFQRLLGAPSYLSLRDRALEFVAQNVGEDHGINPETQVDELSLPGEKDRAELKLAQLSRSLDERVAKAEADARNLEATTRETYDEVARRLNESTAEVKSLAIMRGNARQFIRDELDLLRRHVRRLDRAAETDGALRQTIEDLEGSTDEQIYEAYSKVTSAVAVDEVTLDRLMDVALEIRNGDRFGAEMSPKEFFEAIRTAAANRADLEPFFDRNRPGRPSPLVAAMHRYLVKQEVITDNIRAARLGADAQSRLSSGLRELLGATTETELAAMREAVSQNAEREVVRVFKARDGNERLVFSKVLRSYFRVLARNVELKRSLDRAKQTISLSAVALPSLRELRRASEQRIQASLDFVLRDGAPVIVPNSATDTPEQLVEPSRVREYRSATEGATSNAELVGWLKAQTRWLDARADNPGAQDRLYFTIKNQRDVLQTHLQSEAEGLLRSGITSGYYESITALLRNSGTRVGSIASSMWVQYDALLRRWNGRDRVAGKEWAVVLDRLGRASGVPTRAEVDQLFYQPMAHVLNEVPAEAADAFQLALARVRLNPKARAALLRPGALDAFRDMFRASTKASDYLTSKLKEAGTKVEDEALVTLGLDDEKTPLVRRQIQRGFRTFPRQLSLRVKSAVAEMRGSLRDVADLVGTTPESLAASRDMSAETLAKTIVDQGTKNPPLDYAVQLWNDLAVLSPERLNAVRAVLKKFFNPVAIEGFVRPLVFNFENPSIPAPTIDGVPGGIVRPEVAAAAWDGSDDDVVTFAEKLFDVLNPGGDTTARADYRGQIIRYFGVQFSKLNNLSETQDGIRVASPLGVGHLAMDARIGEGFPQEFLDYMTFGDAEQRSATNTIAINAAFGRDMQGLLRQYETISREVAGWAQEYNDLRAVVGSDEKRAMLRHLREKGDAAGRPIANAETWLEKRSTALSAQNRFNFQSLVKMSGGLLNPDNGLTRDFNLPLEVFDTVIAGLLAAPKSAVKNLSSIIDLVTFYRSPGFASLRALGTGGAAALRQAVASAVSVFGIDAFKNSIANQRFERIGQLDPDRKLTWREMTNETGFNFHLEQTRAGRAQAKIRALRNMLTQYTIKPLGRERGEILAVGFRGPAGIFGWSQTISNLAVAESIIGEFEGLTNRALERAAKDPTYLNGLRSGKLIEGPEVGYTKGVILDDRPAFAALQDHARQMGKPLEQLVLEAADLRAKGLDIFTDDTLSRIYSRAVTEVSLESSVTNNPVGVMGSNLGRVAFRLFRWSWAKQFKMLNMLKTPEGRTEFQTALNGLMAVGLMLLPAGVLFSLMLEQYDEEATGKASNLRPLGGSPENTMMSILERMTVTGTFGFAGDAGNSLLNSAGVSSGGSAKDGGVFSVDNRVVLLSLLGSLSSLASQIKAVGPDNLTYASFYRQLAQITGGGGALQYAQIINQLANQSGFGAPFDEEAKVVARINANNMLRAAGRVLKFEGRASGGAARSNEGTPAVTDMTLAALSNDREAFGDAYRRAIEAAREMGQTDPVAYVKRSFSSRHPLKNLFRTSPTPAEVQQLLRVIGPEGAAQVQEALNYFNRYGQSLGIDPFNGVEDRKKVLPDRDLLEYRRNAVDDL